MAVAAPGGPASTSARRRRADERLPAGRARPPPKAADLRGRRPQDDCGVVEGAGRSPACSTSGIRCGLGRPEGGATVLTLSRLRFTQSRILFSTFRELLRQMLHESRMSA